MINPVFHFAIKSFHLIDTGKNTLVILTPGFAASENDSACLPMHQHFVCTLKKEFPDLNVIVFAFHYPFEKKQYNLFGADVFSFGGSNRRGLTAYLMRRNVRKQLKKIHASSKLIGILSFWYDECAVLGKKFAEAHNIPHYCWVLGQDARKTNFFPARLRPNENELVALSDFLQEEFLKNHGVRPGHVIPPGIELINGFKVRDIDILAVGSLIPLKQYEIFIEMIAQLKKNFPSIKAVIVGEGSERRKFEEKVKVEGLEGTIELKGLLSYHETLEIMQRSKILLHPSSYEGFSGVCMEALAAGMNVVSFCWAMNNDFSQWHIVKDKKSMKEKLIELLENENTPYKCIQLYEMEGTVREMMRLYSSSEFEVKSSKEFPYQ